MVHVGAQLVLLLFREQRRVRVIVKRSRGNSSHFSRGCCRLRRCPSSSCFILKNIIKCVSSLRIPSSRGAGLTKSARGEKKATNNTTRSGLPGFKVPLLYTEVISSLSRRVPPEYKTRRWHAATRLLVSRAIWAGW